MLETPFFHINPSLTTVPAYLPVSTSPTTTTFDKTLASRTSLSETFSQPKHPTRLSPSSRRRTSQPIRSTAILPSKFKSVYMSSLATAAASSSKKPNRTCSTSTKRTRPSRLCPASPSRPGTSPVKPGAPHSAPSPPRTKNAAQSA